MTHSENAEVLNSPSRSPGQIAWREYWNTYRGERRVIEAESRDYVERLSRQLSLRNSWTVLDFGCGSGLIARLLAPRVRHISLWDPSQAARDQALTNTSGLRNVTFIELGAPEADPRETFDLIVANSVVQYMARDEITFWVDRWGRMLAPGGRIVLSDMPGPQSAFSIELLEFLWFATRRGFLLEALRQGFGTIRHYRAATGTRPLHRVDPKLFSEAIATQQWKIEWLPRNLTFRRTRLSLMLTRR